MSCSWPIDRSCLPPVVTELDIAQQQAAEDLAVQVLWSLSGRQFGLCPVKVRPCPGGGGRTYGRVGAPWLVMWSEGNWRNVACGCAAACSWIGPNVVHLASGIGLPVQSVTEVVIAGEVLDESEYALEGDVLYRVGANWPAQDLSRPLDEPGTWSVEYLRGNPPPLGSAKLVGLLAKEFLAACSGGKCRLPRRVKSVARQGVSFDMTDPISILKEGKTGVPEVDLWLQAVNPHVLQSAPAVR